MTTLHSYYPLGVEIPLYIANELSTPALLAIFGAACTIVFSVTTFLAKKANPQISNPELYKTLWFALCRFPAKQQVQP
jgi:cholestenol delta-isomerase